MRKKTAFAMALLPNPEVLFLDEPFEAIDPVTSVVMRQVLTSAASRGVTVFLTSHILPAVDRIAGPIRDYTRRQAGLELLRAATAAAH